MVHFNVHYVPHLHMIAISVSIRCDFAANEGPLLIYINIVSLIKQLYSGGHACQAAANNCNLELWSILHPDRMLMHGNLSDKHTNASRSEHCRLHGADMSFMFMGAAPSYELAHAVWEAQYCQL